MTRIVAAPRTGPRQPASRFEPLRPLIGLFNPLASRIAGRPFLPFWAIVEHRGRRSGRMYRTPIVARRTPNGFVIPLAFGKDADWCRNVFASGTAVIESRGTRYEVSEPNVIGRPEGASAFPGLLHFAVRLAGVGSFLRVSTSAAANAPAPGGAKG